MVICICHRVTCHELRAVIATGVRSVDEVAARCRAGSDCGSCREDIADLIQEAAPPHRTIAMRLHELSLGAEPALAL